jgi:hypothetical protein
MLEGCLQKWVKFEGVSEIVPKKNLGWGHFRRKKKLEWSNCNNLEVWGVKCYILNIKCQSINGWIVQEE